MSAIRNVTLEEAKNILEGALKYAEKQGLAMSFAVVDRSGNLVTINRMDNAKILTTQYAIRKAFTASLLRTSTTELADRIATDKMSYTFYLKGDHRLLYVKGGIPIMDGGKIIGAFGASGAIDTIDEKCVKEGLHYAGFPA